jgi:hypothetical protein
VAASLALSSYSLLSKREARSPCRLRGPPSTLDILSRQALRRASCTTPPRLCSHPPRPPRPFFDPPFGLQDSREEILKAFRLFDDDETGKISFKNLKRVAKELGENMTDEELQEMIDEAHRDGDGEINEEEFLRIMKKTSLY